MTNPFELKPTKLRKAPKGDYTHVLLKGPNDWGVLVADPNVMGQATTVVVAHTPAQYKALCAYMEALLSARTPSRTRVAVMPGTRGYNGLFRVGSDGYLHPSGTVDPRLREAIWAAWLKTAEHGINRARHRGSL